MSATVFFRTGSLGGGGVGGIIKQYADGVFDPETIGILTQAFDGAWRRAQLSKTPYVAEEYAEAGRIILAKHIITAAKAGERDPRWLADSALLYLSRQNLRRPSPRDTP
jgi:3-hydroxy-3-methylglutaryl CoA synthase